MGARGPHPALKSTPIEVRLAERIVDEIIDLYWEGKTHEAMVKRVKELLETRRILPK